MPRCPTISRFPLTLISDYSILDVNHQTPYLRRLDIFRRSLLVASLLFGCIGFSSPINAEQSVSVPPAPRTIGIFDPVQTAGSIDAATATEIVSKKLSDSRLGGGVTAYVVDANSGEVLVDINGSQPMIPASTLKLYTGIAAMNVLGSETRFATRVMRDENILTLVGGGDPTLVSRTPSNWRGKPPGSEQPPSLEQLADLTAVALGASEETYSLNFDDSLFAKPKAHSSWPDQYLRTGEVSAVQGLTMDFGIHETEAVMSDPAKSAASFYVSELVARGLSVTLGDRVTSTGTTEIARVESATVTDIVERMITTSNNTMAEYLAHHLGGTSGQYTFAAGAQVTRQAIIDAGIDISGTEILDGSGLSRSNRTSAKSLVSALQYANSNGGPAWANLSGLPVAGISGTLIDRYEVGEPGRGTVRAKTGTLSKVVALSGTLVDANGELLIYTFIANSIPNGTKQGEAALDKVVKALVQCGCRVA